MAAAVLAAAATVGVEAIGFAFAAKGAVWSWGSVLAKSSFSPSVFIAAEADSPPGDSGIADEPR